MLLKQNTQKSLSINCCRFSLCFSMTDRRGGTLLTYWSGIDSVSEQTIHLSGFYLMNGTNKRRSMTGTCAAKYCSLYTRSSHKETLRTITEPGSDAALQDRAWRRKTQGLMQLGIASGETHRDGTVKATHSAEEPEERSWSCLGRCAEPTSATSEWFINNYKCLG